MIAFVSLHIFEVFYKGFVGLVAQEAVDGRFTAPRLIEKVEDEIALLGRKDDDTCRFIRIPPCMVDQRLDDCFGLKLVCPFAATIVSSLYSLKDKSFAVSIAGWRRWQAQASAIKSVVWRPR
jgi:hypothetical protein